MLYKTDVTLYVACPQCCARNVAVVRDVDTGVAEITGLIECEACGVTYSIVVNIRQHLDLATLTYTGVNYVHVGT